MQFEPGMSSRIEIRIAEPGDAPAIASVLYESFIEYEPLYTAKGFAVTTSSSDEIQNRMNEGPLWVALNGNAIVGTVSAVPKEAALYIRGMGVLPTARGQRIGELLLKQIESFASEHGFVRLFLNTTPFLSRAIRLYETFGFVKSNASEGPHDLFGTPLFTMEKSLET